MCLPTHAGICLAYCGPCAHDDAVAHAHGNEKVLDLGNPLVNVHENDHGYAYNCCHGCKYYHCDRVDCGGGGGGGVILYHYQDYPYADPAAHANSPVCVCHIEEGVLDLLTAACPALHNGQCGQHHGHGLYDEDLGYQSDCYHDGDGDGDDHVLEQP